MTFQVSTQTGPARFDSLPVSQITHYPLEEKDYKPYAQCVLCVAQEELVLRMWAFEVSPMETSSLRGVFYLFQEDSSLALCMDLFSDGERKALLLRDGKNGQEPEELQTLEYHPYSGEDLQGVYWGGTIHISIAVLEKLGGPVALKPGDTFGGNFYKLCATPPFVHSGSSYPADFTGNPYSQENMGRFVVVGY